MAMPKVSVSILIELLHEMHIGLILLKPNTLSTRPIVAVPSRPVHLKTSHVRRQSPVESYCTL